MATTLTRLCIAFVVLTGFAVSVGAAQPLARESFETEAPGAFDGTADQAWTLGAAVETIEEKDLSYRGGGITAGFGNRALKLSGSAPYLNRAVGFDLPTAQTGPVYFSFLAQVEAGAFLQPWVGTSAYPDHQGSGQVYMDGRSGGGKVAGTLCPPGYATLNAACPGNAVRAPVFVVARLSKSGAAGDNYDRLQVVVNPTSPTEPVKWDGDITKDIGVGSLDRFGLRYGNRAAGWIDEIRVGTTWEDVVSRLPVWAEPAALFGDLTRLGADPVPRVKTVTISNAGPRAVDLGPLRITGADSGLYKVTSGPTRDPIPAGGSAEVTVTFTPPEDRGPFHATLGIPTDHPDVPAVAVALDAGFPVRIDADYPGGNIVFERIDGDHVYLHQELRDTPIWWFYWNFRVRGAAGRRLTFHFTNRDVIDLQGPAVSLDEGRTWSWLGPKSVSKTSFSYTFAADADSVRFCYAIPYQEADLQRFLARHEDNPHLRVDTLCRTRKGRNVERLHLGKLDGEPKHRVVLTCRHHSCEMMVSWVLEGALAAILADDDLGRWFQQNVEVVAIPFMDKDGVEEGDQGKARAPHDHNEDYAGEPIYPSVRALKAFLPAWSKGKLRIAIDMHDPYIHDNKIHWVLKPGEPYLTNVRAFVNLVEKGRQGPLSYSPKNEWIWPATSPPVGTKNFGWSWSLSGMEVSTSLELPYSTASGRQVTPDNARALGRDIARGMRSYLTKDVERVGEGR